MHVCVQGREHHGMGARELQQKAAETPGWRSSASTSEGQHSPGEHVLSWRGGNSINVCAVRKEKHPLCSSKVEMKKRGIAKIQCELYQSDISLPIYPASDFSTAVWSLMFSR